MTRRQPSPAPPPGKWKRFVIWWKKLGLEAKIGLLTLVFAILTFFAAAMVVPEFRYWTGLEKRPAERSAEPPQAQPQAPKPKPDEPVPIKPKIKYVPLPNAEPLAPPKNLVTSNPNEGTPQTIAINGEQVPVMTQAALDKYLEHKGPPIFKINPRTGKVDLLVQVGKDGAVDNVQWISGDKKSGEEAKEAIRQWKFKPFTKNGEQVAVQTVIQLSPKMSVQYAQQPDHKKEEKQ